MANDKTYLEIPSTEALQRSQPQARLKRALFSIFIIFSILIALYFATPLSRLGIIHFEGLESLNRSDLISLINIDDDELFLWINLNDIRASIEQHPAVNHVNVSRTGINQLRIAVVEYQVGACAIVDNELIYILADGTMIHENEGIQASCNDRIIHGLSDEELEAGVASLFVSQLVGVDDNVLSLIRTIEYAPLYGDVHRFSLFLVDGNMVNVSSYNMVDQLNLLPALLVRLPEGVTGILHLDVGDFFEPHQIEREGDFAPYPHETMPPYATTS